MIMTREEWQALQGSITHMTIESVSNEDDNHLRIGCYIHEPCEFVDFRVEVDPQESRSIR